MIPQPLVLHHEPFDLLAERQDHTGISVPSFRGECKQGPEEFEAFAVDTIAFQVATHISQKH